MRRFAASCVFVAIAAPAPAGRAPAVNEQVLAACAAFARDGASVAATITRTTLSVDLTDARGTLTHLTRPLAQNAAADDVSIGRVWSCAAYFDRGSDLIAIGVSYLFPTRYLRIAVADVRRSRWTGDWTTGPAAGIFQPALFGFLGETTTLVVGGEPFTPTESGAALRHGVLRSLSFDPHGQPLDVAPVERIYARKGPSAVFADAAHDRLWFFDCAIASRSSRQPDCPLSWLPLRGNASSPPEFDPRTPGDRRGDVWGAHSFAAPDDHTIVVAEGRRIRILDTRSRTPRRMDLPRRVHFPNSESLAGAAALSPDGEVVAFPLVTEHLAFPYLLKEWAYRSTDFAVVQLHPLTLLEILRGGGRGSVVACAVDDRHGHVAALIYRDGRWNRVDVRGR